MASLAGSKKVTVVGAGWSGLASAYFLSKSGFDVQVFESHSDAGGMLSTQMTEHGMVEPAANAMIANPQIMDVAEEIGVELLEPLKSSKKRFFFTKGKIKRWPLDLKKSLHSGLSFIISRGKSPRSGESVYEWGLRIFGKKFTEDVLGTALQGIYGSHDLNQLSASLIFSQFFEKKDKQNKKEKKRSVAPRSGMKEWADKMMIFLKKFYHKNRLPFLI